MNLFTKLNLTVKIDELRQYYNIVETKFNHLRWSWDLYGNTIVKQWSDAVYNDPDNLKTYGWAIQSNLKDSTKVSPPWNISSDDTSEYYNTPIAFGIIEKLQDAIPYGYRWAISVQPPDGKVSLHSDQEDEATVWIPIHTEGVAIVFVTDEKTTGYQLESDGSLYLLDTTIPHYTYNSSNKNRVAVIFRLPRSKIAELLAITGSL